MRKLIASLALVFLLLIPVGCGASSRQMPQEGAAAPAATRPASTYTAPAGGPSYNKGTETPPSGYSGVAYSSNTSDSLTSDRMVVRTGSLELVVQDIGTAMDDITRIAGDSGGYVVSSQKWKEGERVFGTISIRVPAGNYNGTILALRALAMDVISENTSSQDVTDEYTDLGSRVKNLEATEAQLLKIMQTAEKTEDVLSIQRELTAVRGEIEQAKGRIQLLERTSSTSLITIKLNGAVLNLKFSASKVMVHTGDSVHFNSEVTGGFAPYNFQWDFGDGNTSIDKSPLHSYKNPGTYTVVFKASDDKGYTSTASREAYINVKGSWNPGNIARSAWSGFISFGHVVVNVVIWLAIFSPVWIIAGGIVWLVLYRKRKKS